MFGRLLIHAETLSLNACMMNKAQLITHVQVRFNLLLDDRFDAELERNGKLDGLLALFCACRGRLLHIQFESNHEIC